MQALTTERLLTILAGVGSFLWGWWLWRQRQRLIRHGQFTMGTVIGHDEGPIVRFYTQAQQSVTAKHPASPSSRYRLTGASIGVYYNPAKPRDFVLATTEHKVIPLLFMGMGLVFVLAGFFSEFSEEG